MWAHFCKTDGRVIQVEVGSAQVGAAWVLVTVWAHSCKIDGRATGQGGADAGAALGCCLGIKCCPISNVSLQPLRTSSTYAVRTNGANKDT